MANLSATSPPLPAGAPSAAGDPPPAWWLFGPTADVVVFLGSALLSGLALWVGHIFGYLRTESPEWTWICAVLLVDVAHVWSTGFRVYFDLSEIGRRPLLYIGTPLLSWAVGIALYCVGAMVFWRVMAYLAVWHFVRQQYGWVNLYRAKCREPRDWGMWLDTVTIYLCTVYPLIYWHAHLPRNFWWFVAQDFSPSASFSIVEQMVAPVYWLCLLLYCGRSLKAWSSGHANPGKDMVVVTTALCWYVGIVALNSDYAFTVTNVLIHGIPYMALVYYWQLRRHGQVLGSTGYRGVWPFLLTLWALAYAEEMFWDRAIWHDHSWFFGSPWEVANTHMVLVPLLAVPQITHYILDGFIWKRRSNPEVGQVVLDYKTEPHV